MINIWNINTEQDALDVVKSLGTITTETLGISNPYRKRKVMKQLESKMEMVRSHCFINKWQKPLDEMKQYFDIMREAKDSEERLSSQLWEIARR
tara:strand:- start:387 stop:668 length:282 start_codon:yes stop_codon:yes gene_type:complete